MGIRAQRLLGVFSILLSVTADAQLLRFQHIGIEEGLSQDIVTAIVQDSLGFMWFGTEDGLNRYDGYGFSVFKHNLRDTNSLRSSVIEALMVDSQGRLWVGTGRGVCFLEPGNTEFTQLLLDRNGLSFCEGIENEVWIGSSSGLARRDRNGRVVAVPGGSGAWSSVRALLFDRNRRHLFVGSSAGLRVYAVTGEKLTPLPGGRAIASLEGRGITALSRSANGELFVGTLEQGLFCLSADLESIEQYIPDPKNPESLSDYRVIALAEDHQQRLWVGTFSGLDLFDRARKRFVRMKGDEDGPGLRGNRVYSLCVERNGALWVGTYRGGVNRLDPRRQRFGHISQEERPGGLPARNVFSLLETREGDLWVGTDNGLFRKRKGANGFRRYRTNARDGLSPGRTAVFSLYQRGNGEVWAGDGEGVACRYEPLRDEFVQYNLPPADAIKVVYETRSGTLLAGTEFKGAFAFDSLLQRFVPWEVQSDSAWPAAGVWTMYQDRAGYLWLGTFYLPYIVRIDPGSGNAEKIYSDPRNPTMLVNPSVRAICETDNGALFLGTWGGGFARYDRTSDRFTWYTETEGLSSNFVKAMQTDDRGRLWIATEKGLVRFDPATESFKTYTGEDGLQSNFFWSGSSCKGSNGMLYFGGTNGFNMFHPDSITDNAAGPPVVITSVRVLDQPFFIPSDRTINLTHEADYFSFEFVALDYTTPHRNQYAYMLDGFDKTWVFSGTRRYAAYTHLDPGRYIFRVRGSNSDGVWNEEGVSLAVVIAPPYWMTWWFRGLAVTVFVAGLYGVYRYRLHQVLKVERLRQQIGQDLHDDIGTNLSAIVIASQVIRRQRHATQEVCDQVDDISGIALRTQELMRDIVWMLNPKNDTLQEFVGRMKHEAASLLKEKAFEFSASEGSFPEKVGLEFKRNVFLIYKEALNNIVKHARATSVSIAVGVENGCLKLMVRDNGVGFDVRSAGQGNGLSNMHSRARRIGADLLVSSTPEEGSAVELKARIT